MSFRSSKSIFPPPQQQHQHQQQLGPLLDLTAIAAGKNTCPFSLCLVGGGFLRRAAAAKTPSSVAAPTAGPPPPDPGGPRQTEEEETPLPATRTGAGARRGSLVAATTGRSTPRESVRGTENDSIWALSILICSLSRLRGVRVHPSYPSSRLLRSQERPRRGEELHSQVVL